MEHISSISSLPTLLFPILCRSDHGWMLKFDEKFIEFFYTPCSAIGLNYYHLASFWDREVAKQEGRMCIIDWPYFGCNANTMASLPVCATHQLVLVFTCR